MRETLEVIMGNHILGNNPMDGRAHRLQVVS